MTALNFWSTAKKKKKIKDIQSTDEKTVLIIICVKLEFKQNVMSFEFNEENFNFIEIINNERFGLQSIWLCSVAINKSANIRGYH